MIYQKTFSPFSGDESANLVNIHGEKKKKDAAMSEIALIGIVYCFESENRPCQLLDEQYNLYRVIIV